MSDDLVKRLRGPSGVKDWQTAIHIHAKDARAAADRIEALEAELQSARSESRRAKADAYRMGREDQAAATAATVVALAEMDPSLFTNAEHQRAKDILREAREATK